MNISDWDLFYKIENNELVTTQMCYEPRVNPEGNIFCMNFVYPCEYQTQQRRISYTKEHVDSMFQRELKYLNKFKDTTFCPEIIDITDHQIFIKWYNKSCNQSLYRDNDLSSNWYKDIENIILTQVDMGYLKCTMYPHSHYYDNNGCMRSIDFYATVEKDNPVLTVRELEGLIGLDTTRFADATTGDLINIEHIFKSGLLEYSKWPVHLTEIYNKIYDIHR